MTWNKRVIKRQHDYVSPMVIRPLIDRLIEMGVLSEPKEYEIKWPSIVDESEMSMEDDTDTDQ